MSNQEEEKQRLIEKYESVANAYEMELEERQQLKRDKERLSHEIVEVSKIETKLQKNLKDLTN